MSVCIAAIARDSGICVCSDKMVSLFGGAMTGPFMSKGHVLERLPSGWFAFVAGDDVSGAIPVTKQAREMLSDKDRHGVKEVSEAVAQAFQAEKLKRATDNVLSPYDIDMKTFLSNGVLMFGDSGYAILRDRIEKVRLNMSMLVAGFDVDDEPQIFTVTEPEKDSGYVTFFTQPGFWAIGSGDHNALVRLAIRGQNEFCTIEETVYNVIEAKAAAEFAHGVGDITFLAVHYPKGQPIKFLSTGSNVTAAVRSAAKAALRPSVPEAVMDIIRNNLRSTEQSTSQKSDSSSQADGESAETDPNRSGG